MLITVLGFAKINGNYWHSVRLDHKLRSYQPIGFTVLSVEEWNARWALLDLFLFILYYIAEKMLRQDLCIGFAFEKIE